MKIVAVSDPNIMYSICTGTGVKNRRYFAKALSIKQV